MTKQKIVKAISRNRTWGSEIVQPSEDNVTFWNRISDNLLLRKLDVLKLACNQKSDEFTTLTVNEIVQENTPDIQPQKKPRLIACLKKNTIYSTSENINGRNIQKIQTSKFFLLKRIEVEPGEPENRKQLTELQNLLVY